MGALVGSPDRTGSEKKRQSRLSESAAPTRLLPRHSSKQRTGGRHRSIYGSALASAQWPPIAAIDDAAAVVVVAAAAAAATVTEVSVAVDVDTFVR